MTADGQDFNALARELLEALLSVNRLAVKDVLTRPVAGLPPVARVEQLGVPALDAIGSGWEKGEYALSQVYMSGRICEEVVDLILPPTDITRRSQPKMAIATLDDYHLLGKRIVYSTLRASGIELLNYGRMEADELAQRVLQDQVEILLVSVLMLPSALKVRELRHRLERSGRRVRLAVGGAPFRFDRQLWHEVGADACGDTAAEAVNIVGKMIEEVG